jgi:hypothetical protein
MSRDGLEPSTLGLKVQTVKISALAAWNRKSETPAHGPELVHEMLVVAPDLFSSCTLRVHPIVALGAQRHRGHHTPEITKAATRQAASSERAGRQWE